MSTNIRIHHNTSTQYFSVAPGVWGLRDIFVNMYMILNPFDGNWVLLDTGLKWSAPKIRRMAKHLFGEQGRPSSIILTHGHFDHVGSLHKLAREWNVPVFAHYLEVPFLTGKSFYPPPDPTTGGGLMSLMSFLYPSSPINITNHLVKLPDNGRVPGLPEWRYIHTPGHAPGHISLYRESDGVLIAGDAFVTTRSESALSTLLQSRKLSGPPKYFTYDWVLAKESVKRLESLQPEIAASGHGRPMHGDLLRNSLYNLAAHFYQQAVPPHGRYVNESAVTNASGVVYTPPPNGEASKLLVKVLAITMISAILYLVVTKKKKQIKKQKHALAYEIW